MKRSDFALIARGPKTILLAILMFVGSAIADDAMEQVLYRFQRHDGTTRGAT